MLSSSIAVLGFLKGMEIKRIDIYFDDNAEINVKLNTFVRHGTEIKNK